MNEAVIFLHTNDLVVELNRPQNTFIPHHPESRPRKNLEQEKAIIEIEQNIRSMEKIKHNKKRLKQLKLLRDNLLNQTGEWTSLIAEVLRTYKGMFIKHTHTYKMLTKLCQTSSHHVEPNTFTKSK